MREENNGKTNYFLVERDENHKIENVQYSESDINLDMNIL